MLITKLGKKLDVNKGLAVGIGIAIAAAIAGTITFVLSTSQTEVQETEELPMQDIGEQETEPATGKHIEVTVTEKFGFKEKP